MTQELIVYTTDASRDLITRTYEAIHATPHPVVVVTAQFAATLRKLGRDRLDMTQGSSEREADIYNPHLASGVMGKVLPKGPVIVVSSDESLEHSSFYGADHIRGPLIQYEV